MLHLLRIEFPSTTSVSRDSLADGPGSLPETLIPRHRQAARGLDDGGALVQRLEDRSLTLAEASSEANKWARALNEAIFPPVGGDPCPGLTTGREFVNTDGGLVSFVAKQGQALAHTDDSLRPVQTGILKGRLRNGQEFF